MIEPGQTCDTCGRKVPHERKPASPVTKPVSYRVPLDELDAHKVVLDEAARHLGVAEQPFSHFKVVSLACALVLQDESLVGFGRRQAA